MSAQGQEPVAPTTPEAPAPEAAPPPAAPAGPDLNQIYTRMEDMAAQQRAIVEHLTAVPEDEVEEEYEYYTDDGGLTEDGARALIRGLVDEQVEARMAPRERQAMIAQRDDAFEALREEYPELQDEAVVRRVLD